MTKITHYYVDCGYFTQTKNKLQSDFLKYLQSLNGMLVDEKQLEKLQKQIIAKQAELNKIHFRCKSLDVTFYFPVRSTNLRLSGFDFVNFFIRAAHFTEL